MCDWLGLGNSYTINKYIYELPVFTVSFLKLEICAFEVEKILCHFFSTSSTERCVVALALNNFWISTHAAFFLMEVTLPPSLLLNKSFLSLTSVASSTHSSDVQFGLRFGFASAILNCRLTVRRMLFIFIINVNSIYKYGVSQGIPSALLANGLSINLSIT